MNPSGGYWVYPTGGAYGMKEEPFFVSTEVSEAQRLLDELEEERVLKEDELRRLEYWEKKATEVEVRRADLAWAYKQKELEDGIKSEQRFREVMLAHKAGRPIPEHPDVVRRREARERGNKMDALNTHLEEVYCDGQGRFIHMYWDGDIIIDGVFNLDELTEIEAYVRQSDLTNSTLEEAHVYERGIYIPEYQGEGIEMDDVLNLAELTVIVRCLRQSTKEDTNV